MTNCFQIKRGGKWRAMIDQPQFNVFLVQLNSTIDIITRISFTKMIGKFLSYKSVVYTAIYFNAGVLFLKFRSPTFNITVIINVT